MPNEPDERERELAVVAYEIYSHIRVQSHIHEMTQAETMVVVAQVITSLANEWAAKDPHRELPIRRS